MLRKRPALVVGVVVLATLLPAGATALRSQQSLSSVQAVPIRGLAAQGQPSTVAESRAATAEKGKAQTRTVVSKPEELHLRKAHSAVFDARTLRGKVVKRERPEYLAPGLSGAEPAENPAAILPEAVDPTTITAAALSAQAPATDANFEGLDFNTWGTGHPPDTNGDVGPTYYIQTINSSIGIFSKTDGVRVAAFTFNAFMSQGKFGNVCDTNNFGDPVVLYDTFEDRWFITDFAYQRAPGEAINPPHVFQCFAVSKNADPVGGGWNFYSIESPGGLDDYPKFAVWPDGIYMSANLFTYAAAPSLISPHVWAINKAQMYAGEPSVQAVDFAAPAADFTLLPSNARLQTGTPPSGTPNYFASTSQFTNALSVYKLHVDWDKISTSTFTGPELTFNATSWPNVAPTSAATPGNAADVLAVRTMAQNQYSNLDGSESLWLSHTIRRGISGITTGTAHPRWYQLNVTGGTVAANTLQGATWDPDGANTFFRFMPSLAVDRMGDMALGYTKSNSVTNPQLKYAGRLAGDPVNTFSQTEQTLIDGTGAQTGNCGGAACIRWGDYSGMALDPNGCTFWQTGEYYQVDGLDHHTRIGSFSFPGCATVDSGTLSGTVSDGSDPIGGATITLGSRTTTTDVSGNYSLSVPSGTYPSLTASKAGFGSASTSSVTVPDGATATRDFTLTAAPTSGCFLDNTPSAFQRGVPSSCDLTSSPGAVQLTNPVSLDQQQVENSGSGLGMSTTTWLGQTFTPAVTGRLTRLDLSLFCGACSGPDLPITVEVRTASGGLPTGTVLATTTIPGFSGGSSAFYPAIFSSPPTLTTGTQYAYTLHVATPRTGTYVATFSTTPAAYPSGNRVASVNSGAAWGVPLSSGTARDLVFKTYMQTGFPSSGTFVSGLKDANPGAGREVEWTTFSFAAATPAGTDIKFQLAASNNTYGPFDYVGPDGTAGTFFTTSGADLSQFDGFRYLRYKALLSTNSSTATPTLSEVTVCFDDLLTTSLTVDPATGTYGGTTALSATLEAGSDGVSGKTIDFTLNGTPVGSATTDTDGVAKLTGVGLAGIGVGSYPGAVEASFAGDATHGPSSGSSSLTIDKADQAINVTTNAPATAVYNTGFAVAATGGGSGNGVTFSSAGVCTNSGASFTMTSGTGSCAVAYDQAGDDNYKPAAQVTEIVTAQKANQTITVTTHAPSTAAYNTSFGVQANAPAGLVAFSSTGVCSSSGNTFTMTSGTGICSVNYDQAGDDNYNAAPQVTEFVGADKPVLSVKPTPLTASRQYSDPNPSFTPDITGFVNGDDATDLATQPNCSTNATASSGPDTDAIDCSGGADANYSFAYTPGTLNVTQEDARATYNGNLLFWTSSPTSTSANVTLSATIRDITAVDPVSDADGGDIRNARVTFVNRDTNAAFAGCSNLTVGLVNTSDTKTGTASCSTSLTASNTGATQYTVGMVVSRYYSRNASTDDEIIDVAQPLTSDFITGGGYLVLANSAGQKAGEAGSKSNFGLNVKYNKSGKNLQGNVNVIVRNGDRVYQIKGNAISSLGVVATKASFTGKANVQDITDPLNPASVDGDATLQLWMTDNGDPGTKDTLGIQVLGKTGGVWFSSNWNGTKTVEQNLGGGTLAVR